MKPAKAWGSCIATEITKLYKDCNCLILKVTLCPTNPLPVPTPMRYLSITDFVLDHWKSQIRKNLPEYKKDGGAWASHSHQKDRKPEGLTKEPVFDNYHDYEFFLILAISNTWPLPIPMAFHFLVLISWFLQNYRCFLLEWCCNNLSFPFHQLFVQSI